MATASASGLISIAKARDLVLAAARAGRPATEQVAVESALDRVLAADVGAAGDVPPFACSAMDGYAIVAGPARRVLTVVGESRAGAPAAHPLQRADQAIRISTGAAVPPGADAVIRQEDTDTESLSEPTAGANGDRIVTTAPTAPGDNIRGAGEDLRTGQPVLPAGTRLGVAELGAAVAAGAAALTVARKPAVTILSTGDELRSPGERLGPGQIHNSNAVTLAALAVRAGATVNRSERIADARQPTEDGLATALGDSDVVVISGGVSVGPHDHVKPALAALGVEERFWGVALQPGKPTWFGTRGGRLVFGLPGNPVSAVVTFVLFAAPALAALQGAEPAGAGADQTAELTQAVRRNPHREQAMRVRISNTHGRLSAAPTGPQGSHLITSLLGADALALIPRGDGDLPAGAQVQLVMLPR